MIKICGDTIRMRYQVKDVSEQFGIDVSTVRTWARQFDIPHTRSGNKWSFDNDSIQVFQAIQRLKNDGRGMNTIRSLIETGSGHDQDKQVLNITRSGNVQDLATIQQAIVQAMQESNELSEKYARATYEIGELRNEVKHQQITIEALRSDKKALEERLMALPSPEQHQAVEAKLEAMEKKTARSTWSRLLAWFSK